MPKSLSEMHLIQSLFYLFCCERFNVDVHHLGLTYFCHNLCDLYFIRFEEVNYGKVLCQDLCYVLFYLPIHLYLPREVSQQCLSFSIEKPSYGKKIVLLSPCSSHVALDRCSLKISSCQKNIQFSFNNDGFIHYFHILPHTLQLLYSLLTFLNFPFDTPKTHTSHNSTFSLVWEIFALTLPPRRA